MVFNIYNRLNKIRKDNANKNTETTTEPTTDQVLADLASKGVQFGESESPSVVTGSNAEELLVDRANALEEDDITKVNMLNKSTTKSSGFLGGLSALSNIRI